MSNDLEKQGNAKKLTIIEFQKNITTELNLASDQMGAPFSDYGKQCILNSLAGIIMHCTNNKIPTSKINQSMLKMALQNVGYTELNYAAIPAEVYFDLRRIVSKDEKGNDVESYSVKIMPQGAGYEKLTRRFGVGLKKDGLYSPWLVREGDEFTFPSFDGLTMTEPKWTPKFYDKKVIMVVYPAVKNDDRVEYLIATRESVKANIIAQIRQNTLYEFTKERFDKKTGKVYKDVDVEAREKFYAELNDYAEEHTVDQLIKEEKFASYLNPTYISGGSKESMILRKMKNNALKNYPKEYDTAYIRNAVESMYEDVDESLDEEPVKKDVVRKVEKEISEPQTADAVADFNVDNNGEIKDVPSTSKEEIKESAPVAKEEEPSTPADPEEPQKEEEPKEEDYGF